MAVCDWLQKHSPAYNARVFSDTYQDWSRARLDACISVTCFIPIISATLHGVSFIMSLRAAAISSTNPTSAGIFRGSCHTQVRDKKYALYYKLPFILKGKAIPLQAWTGPKDSSRLRLPDFKTIGT